MHILPQNSKYIKIAGFLAFFFLVVAPLHAMPIPASEVLIDFGEVTFRSVPSSELRDVEAVDPDMVMGATLARFKVEYGAVLDREMNAEGCLPVNAVKIAAGYSSFDIMIDERYEPGSCEYDAIAGHELEHVRIYRNELAYYGKLIEDELLISSLNMSEVCTEGGTRAEFREKARSILRDDERINLLFVRLDESVREKNAAFDSMEEYLRVKGQCSNW